MSVHGLSNVRAGLWYSITVLVFCCSVSPTYKQMHTHTHTHARTHPRTHTHTHVPYHSPSLLSGLTPIHIATQEASLDVLKFLFTKEANKNAIDTTSGRTALHYAVEQENVRLVSFLIQEGCDTNAATYSGTTH